MPELIPLPQEPRPIDMSNFFRDDANGAGNHLGDTINGANQEKAATDAAPRSAQQVFESVLTKPEFHQLAADEFEFVVARGADGEIHRHWQSIDPARRGYDPYEQVESSTVEQWRRQLLRHEEPAPFIFTNHNGDLASKHPDMSVVRKMVAQYTKDLMAQGAPQPIPVRRPVDTGTMRVRPREYGSTYEPYAPDRVPAPAARAVSNVVAGTVLSGKVGQSGQHRRVKQPA